MNGTWLAEEEAPVAVEVTLEVDTAMTAVVVPVVVVVAAAALEDSAADDEVATATTEDEEGISAQISWLTFRVVSASAVEQAFKTHGVAALVIAASFAAVHWQAWSERAQLVLEEMASVMQDRAQEGRSEMETALAILAARPTMEIEYFMLTGR